MADITTINCSLLATRTSFGSYINTLNNLTNGNISLAQQCNQQLCSALWGSGNPDISGIGMLVGYILDNVIGLLLALCAVALYSPQLRWLRTKRRVQARSPKSPRFSRIVESYYGSAVFLALSLQIASIVVLARADFGITTAGFGDVTMRITWTASVLTLLPLLYGAFVPGLWHVEEDAVSFSGCGGECGCKAEMQRRARLEEFRRNNLRIYLFVAAWVFSVYPFLSNVLENFGPSKIGDGKEAVISTEEWQQIEEMCFQGVAVTSQRDDVLITVTSIVGWAFVSIFALAAMVEFGVKRNLDGSDRARLLEPWFVLPSPARDEKKKAQTLHVAVLLTVTPTIAALEIYSFFRLQAFQKGISEASGNAFGDRDWTFGQLVAVTVFTPMLAEMWYSVRDEYFIKDEVE